MTKSRDISENNMLVDALVRIKTIETLLLKKNVFTAEEYAVQMKEITDHIVRTILEKAKEKGPISEELDQMVRDLQKAN